MNIMMKETALIIIGIDLYKTLITFRISSLDTIDRLLEKLQPEMIKVVNGDFTSIVDWSPKTRNTDRGTYLQSLHIPALYADDSEDEGPVLILRELGEFKHDPILGERLQNIFEPGQHAQVSGAQLGVTITLICTLYCRFLVNTSGSGKTRLLFEGLCRHWGIYFTSVDDTSGLGSTDLLTAFSGRFLSLTPDSFLPDIDSPSFETVLERHRTAAKRTFGEILLARLLVFRSFATIVHEKGSCDDHKRRWLLLQLRSPELFGQDDIFETVRRHLEDVTDTFLNDTITNSIGDLHRLCRIDSGLFFALDETNHAISQCTEYFRDKGGDYPIFKEMLRYWKGYAESFKVTFVVAGTEIPKHLFQYEPGEWDYMRWLSDTGAFDDEESHRRYIGPFLPPPYRDSESGKALMRRMWQWLRGR